MTFKEFLNEGHSSKTLRYARNMTKGIDKTYEVCPITCGSSSDIRWLNIKFPIKYDTFREAYQNGYSEKSIKEDSESIYNKVLASPFKKLCLNQILPCVNSKQYSVYMSYFFDENNEDEDTIKEFTSKLKDMKFECTNDVFGEVTAYFTIELDDRIKGKFDKLRERLQNNRDYTEWSDTITVDGFRDRVLFDLGDYRVEVGRIPFTCEIEGDKLIAKVTSYIVKR